MTEKETHLYDDWADIYDRVYADLNHDVPFYVQQALASGGPVLELGSGTGRVALALAAAGIEVHGVDVSPRMVQRAQEKAEAAGLADACRFQQGDMRTVRLDKRFPLVIMPFRSFQNMLSVDDQRAALATVKAHLEAGGCLAFDVFAPDPRMLATDDPAPFHVHTTYTSPTPATRGRSPARTAGTTRPRPTTSAWSSRRWHPAERCSSACTGA